MSLFMRRVSGHVDRSILIRTFHDHRNPQDIVVHIPQANVFRFGDSNRASPVFKNVEWTVNEGESWAVIGSGGKKTALLQVREVSFISGFWLSTLLTPNQFGGTRYIWSCDNY